MDAPSHHRDHEAAYVSLNGQKCWSKTDITAPLGTPQCGGQSRFRAWNEAAVSVAGCSITLSGSGYKPLTVRVWTNLDRMDAKEESFGIDNVVIQSVQSGSCCYSHHSNCIYFLLSFSMVRLSNPIVCNTLKK